MSKKLIGSLLSFMANRGPQGIDSPLEYNFDLASQGIRIVRQAKPLFPIKFEEGLIVPLSCILRGILGQYPSSVTFRSKQVVNKLNYPEA